MREDMSLSRWLESFNDATFQYLRTSYLANIFCWFWNHYCIASVHNSCRYQTKFCQSCSSNCWTLNRYVFQPGSRRNGGQPEGVLGLSAVGLHLNSSSQLWTVFWLIGLPPYWRVSLPYGFIFSWTFDHKKGVTGLVFFSVLLVDKPIMLNVSLYSPCWKDNGK
jgi:hypothetical protein